MTAVPPNAVPTEAVPAKSMLTNAVTDRLIAAGRRPVVLGAVDVGSSDDLAGALFDALAHVSNGADGIDLSLPAALAPSDRRAIADQLGDATGAAIYLRTDIPMAVGDHRLIVSAAADRPRGNAVLDIGIDRLGFSVDSSDVADAWPALDDGRSLLVCTRGFQDLSDAALMGLVSAASARCIAAVSTDRVRIARRVVDTLAPLFSKTLSGRPSTQE